eukprot:COSAG01_NODE_4818_length_4723_cov_7.881055_4_plen_102_part_00
MHPDYGDVNTSKWQTMKLAVMSHTQSDNDGRIVLPALEALANLLRHGEATALTSIILFSAFLALRQGTGAVPSNPMTGTDSNLVCAERSGCKKCRNREAGR